MEARSSLSPERRKGGWGRQQQLYHHHQQRHHHHHQQEQEQQQQQQWPRPYPAQHHPQVPPNHQNVVVVSRFERAIRENERLRIIVEDLKTDIAQLREDNSRLAAALEAVEAEGRRTPKRSRSRSRSEI
jgi:hypothetical protein